MDQAQPEEQSQTEQELKLSYVNTQITEMEAIIRRNEVDIYINKDIKWLPHEQKGVDAQIETLETENEKLSKAVVSLKKLKLELEK